MIITAGMGDKSLWSAVLNKLVNHYRGGEDTIVKQILP